MKIHDKFSGNQHINSETQKVSGPEGKDRVPERGKTVSTDKVDISQKAKELLAAINQLPEIREDKVRSVNKAIEAGNYNVDPVKLAEKILKEL
jgi:flagellar biosynthesis anti-sigma factor FlgM